MISMFFLFPLRVSDFEASKTLQCLGPWSRSIRFQERLDLAEEKARLVEGAPAGRGLSSHGGSPVVTMG